MSTIIAVTIFLAAVIGFSMLMKHFRKQGVKTKDKSILQQPPKPTESPEEEFKKILDVLIKLNLLLRKDRNLDREMMLKIEGIIDDLKVVIPTMMERYPGETLTYEIKKIGLTHLYKTTKEFLDMSVESRQAQFNTFNDTIQNLHEVSHRSRDIVENNETAEFKTMAHFLAGKFS